tara:strand:+ start:417 stop:908 length:492 start_codon:yes stop_codon:yes gene_type:complete
MVFDREKWNKEYYEKNKEKIAKKNKEYNKTPKRQMGLKINMWKRNGLICENREEYEYIYDRWLFSERCEEPKCNKEYTKDNIKNMDHCHDTGLFRNIICHSCNMKRRSKENSSGITNIYWSNYKNRWVYRINIKGQKHSKSSKDLEWLKQYKIDYEKENLYNI